MRPDTVTEDVAVAGFFLDRIEPAAQTSNLIVFGVRVAEVGVQIVTFDGLDPLAHHASLMRRSDDTPARARKRTATPSDSLGYHWRVVRPSDFFDLALLLSAMQTAAGSKRNSVSTLNAGFFPALAALTIVRRSQSRASTSRTCESRVPGQAPTGLPTSRIANVTCVGHPQLRTQAAGPTLKVWNLSVFLDAQTI